MKNFVILVKISSHQQNLTVICINMSIKLSEWAKQNGVHYRTAYNWFKKGKFPGKAIQLPSGTILVEDVPLFK